MIQFRKINPLYGCILLLFLLPALELTAQYSAWVADSTVQLIDGNSPRFSQVQPGDTIFLPAGNRDKLLIRNLSGSSAQPVVIMNTGGTVHINTSHYYGLSISACRYLRISGQGDSTAFYGFQINRVGNGAGIGISNRSSDIEIDHLLIENCFTAGIYAKTDPDCSFLATREKFTQFNTRIHDNSISHVGNEGMYIGSSFYSGVLLNCNGKDSLVFPPVLNGVQVYNNKVSYTGWDAIQVSSAVSGCAIYGNTIGYDSQSATDSQMSGILIGGGSKCDCSHNYISHGKGDGIEDHGLGGNRIFNNIIINAGRSYFPDDPAKMKHGIFVSDVSVQKDSAFTIVFNTILQPKSDGIRFQSVKSSNSLIASNLVADPGNYDYYGLGTTFFRGKDAYVMQPSPLSSIQLQHNFFTRTVASARLSAEFAPLTGSPLINQGYQYNLGITDDFLKQNRPCGDWYDIGAVEYTGGADSLISFSGFNPVAFPVPAYSEITIRYLNKPAFPSVIAVYSVLGNRVLQQTVSSPVPGIQDVLLPLNGLPAGLFLFTIRTGAEISRGKFIKL
jgi:Right handed beta helix region